MTSADTKKNVIIGTAGHVDHGKTCLIRALTGTDTDRLAEEKKRGITIELGFADLENDRGLRIGIIDVPGHERFIKNMLAGIGGIDLVLFVVALDEGVMPQTVEHFEILKSLHIRKGILVLTKKDLVDDEWADLVEEDLRKLVAGSFLEHAPSIRVSSFTGENIDALREMILSSVSETPERRTAPELFRLPADRVFTMKGFGTVVTGTLVEGSIRVGDEIAVYPSGLRARVREIQNNGADEDRAWAGQRTALNLTGIRREDLERGAVLAREGGILPGKITDVKVSLFDNTKRILRNGDRVHVSFGAAETVCKVVLLSRDEIAGGEKAYAQFHFEEDVPVKTGDRFIIRFFSPVETFGGGVFLEADARKRRRKRVDSERGLEIFDNGTVREKMEEEILEYAPEVPDAKILAVRRNLSRAETGKLLDTLEKEGRVVRLDGNRCVHRTCWEEVAACAKMILSSYHKDNPIEKGMGAGEFLSRLDQNFHMGMEMAALFQREFLRCGIIAELEGKTALPGFSPAYSDKDQSERARIIELYRGAGCAVPENASASALCRNPRQGKQILAALAREGILTRIDNDHYMFSEVWDQCLKVVRRHFAGEGKITLAQFRDDMQTTRRYAQTILEAMDRKKITKLVGDVRVDGMKF